MVEILEQLESIASELVATFQITAPPIPIESILQQPKEEMWEKVDPNQLTDGIFSIKAPFSPRMSVARLLARHVASSSWGRERGLMKLITDEEILRAFARMLVMPREMVMALSHAARNPTAMSTYFEVPEEDAHLRLQELTGRL